MYNKQLNAFVKAAETGSFTKAAKLLYLAPASLIQQINALEDHLGIRLFDRGPRGATLTEAGQLLYRDAQDIMRLSEAAIRRARAVQEGAGPTIRIGTNMLMKCRYLTALCSRLIDEKPDVTIELVSVISPDDASWKPLKGLGSDYDMVEGLYLSGFYHGKCGFVEIDRVPLAAALPPGHRLLERSEIALEDLRGEAVVMQQRGVSKEFDKLRDALEAAGGVSFVDVLHYSVQTFTRCELEGTALIAPAIWEDLHPNLKARPLRGAPSIRYGIMHSPQLGKQAATLVSLAERELGAKGFRGA